MSSTPDEMFRDFVTKHNYDVKPHQLKGFKWCYERETEHRHGGGLLCDEMGLGKTILMLACMKLNPKKNTLIVVPRSLIGQWREKIIELLGKKPLVFHGAFAKGFIYNNELEEQLDIMSKRIFISTYGMLKSVLSKHKWERIIYDEAHNMKTKQTQVFKNAMKVEANIKWMVTGTPIQNSWRDVLSICKLLKFPEGEEILEKQNNREDQREYIKSIMLVRTKKQVKIKMPELKVHTIKVKSTTQEEHSLMTDIHSKLMCSKISTNKPARFPILDRIGDIPLVFMLRARQVCSNPKMLETCIKKVFDEAEDKKSDMPDFSIMTNSKLAKIISTMETYDKSTKKIVFYTFHKEMTAMKQLLEQKNYVVGVLNGRTDNKKKQDIITSNNYDVLLIQIKSGSDGLNLQQYSQVYFVSPHWNPAVEKQAIARVYRLGQKAKQVNVFYFISTFDKKNRYTIDEYCLIVKRKKTETLQYLYSNTKKQSSSSSSPSKENNSSTISPQLPS